MGLKARANFDHDGMEFSKGQDLTQTQAEELGKEVVKSFIETGLLEVTEKHQEEKPEDEGKKSKGKKKFEEE